MTPGLTCFAAGLGSGRTRDTFAAEPCSQRTAGGYDWLR
jgi:hypothetical protein